MICLRFKSKDIRDSVAFISRLRTRFSNGVDEVHAGHPLVNGELDLPSEIVKVSNESRHNLPCSGISLGSHGVNDALGEVWVKSVRCRHFVMVVRIVEA